MRTIRAMFVACALALVLGACLVSVDESKLKARDAGAPNDSSSASDAGADA